MCLLLKIFRVFSSLIISMSIIVPVFASEKATSISSSKKCASKMSETDKTKILQVFDSYKTALNNLDVKLLLMISADETHEMIVALKSNDKETKEYLTEHFRNIGKALASGKFDSPYASGDTVFIKGKAETTKLSVEFIREKSVWKVLSAIVDESESSAQKLVE